MQRKGKTLLVAFMIAMIAVFASTTLAYRFNNQDTRDSPSSELQQTEEQEQRLEQKIEKDQEQSQTPAQELEQARKPWEEAWLSIYFHIPREINQVNYFQTIENVSVISNIPPSGTAKISDTRPQFGNDYMIVYWDEEQSGEIVASIEVTLVRKVETTPVNVSDPYPVNEDSLPEDVKLYLEPSFFVQSDDPAIVALAQNLSQGCSKEIEVIYDDLNWIHENIRGLTVGPNETISASALWTLENKKGNCMLSAHLMIALLRAQGIPARYVFGYTGNEPSNPGFLKPIPNRGCLRTAGHAWVEVYYPETGWVHYDPSYTKDIPYGIPIEICPDAMGLYGLVHKSFSGDYTEEWNAIGIGALENNIVKLTFTITVWQEQ